MTLFAGGLADAPPLCVLRRAALAYADQFAWRVFPLSPREKVPLIPKAIGGSGCLDGTADASQIHAWWQEWPNANIGIATGPGSGLVVIDVDPRNGGDENLLDLQEEVGRLPATVHAITGGGGAHYLFRHPGQGLRVKNFTLRSGVDVKGDGGYIVAPPSIHSSGRRYEWEASSRPGEIALAHLPGALLELIVASPHKHAVVPIIELNDGPELLERIRRARGYLARMPPAISGQGGHQATWLAALALIRGFALPIEVAFELLGNDYNPRCSPPWSQSELRHKIESAHNDASVPTGYLLDDDIPVREISALDPPPGQTAEGTDLAAAEALVRLHGADLRYIAPLGGWHAWDGRRWRRADRGEAEQRAKAVARQLVADAAGAIQKAAVERDEVAVARAKKQLHLACRAQSARGLEAMLALAATEPGIPCSPDELDSDPWLLNCLNGTIDLRTGELGPHRGGDLITKLCPVAYDPRATSPLWERLLREATAQSAETIDFLRRAVGYSLTGVTSEEKLFFVHGPGATGKSTFLEALKATLGEYAVTADFSSFVSRSNGNPDAPRNDIARLAGSRFVVSIEVDDGKRLAEGLVTMLTGCDTVTARFMYRESFEFRPTFKLWLAANHAPRIHDDHDAMWRRILRLPFEQVVPKEKRDPKVKALLTDPAVSGPAILAWAVQGCLEWQRQGLGVPPVIEQATEAYRQTQDPLADFFVECCAFEPEAKVARSDLRKAYEKWAEENGERYPLRPKDFTARVRARAEEVASMRVADRSGPVRGWRGIRLKSASEREASLVVGSQDVDTDSGKFPIVSLSREKLSESLSTSDDMPTQMELRA